jgi:hypothetical protein
MILKAPIDAIRREKPKRKVQGIFQAVPAARSAISGNSVFSAIFLPIERVTLQFRFAFPTVAGVDFRLAWRIRMGSRRRGSGRRKVGRKKRRMRAKIRHRK